MFDLLCCVTGGKEHLKGNWVRSHYVGQEIYSTTLFQLGEASCGVDCKYTSNNGFIALSFELDTLFETSIAYTVK